jgi:hypothetical protein
MHDECDFVGPGPWKLPVVGFAVDMLWFTYPFVVIAHGEGGKHLKAQLNGAFDYHDPATADLRLNAETDSWETLAVLFALRQDRIERAHVSTASALRIEFASGRSLSANPDDRYDGWELVGPGFYIVGSPDEPAIWTGKDWDQ